MRTIDDTINECMKNPKFKREWDALEPEYQLIRAMLDAREAAHLTQQELARITGISQADISRIESGDSNPSFKTLKRIANGLGATLKISFVPNPPQTV